MRLIHIRLQLAGGLAGHTLYLDCHHPAARTPAGKLLCDASATDGLSELLPDIHNDQSYIGQVQQVFNFYTRFKPQRRDSEVTIRPWAVPGDIPGSRTHPSSNVPLDATNLTEAVSRTVTVDAHEIFTQLSTAAHLRKPEPKRGVMFFQQVGEGHIRIWRNWLAEQCESKKWTDGEPIAVYHDTPSSPTSGGKARADSLLSPLPPNKDPSVLWVDSRDENVGIKFRVKERVWKSNPPVSYSSDIESAVSYVVQLEGKGQDL